jgi:signal peptidase I
MLIDEELEGHQYKVRWLGDSTQVRKVTQGVVPTGQVFFLGDHRSRGQDSRNWGFVSASYIKGTASFIWFSKTKNGIQWKRIFKGVE